MAEKDNKRDPRQERSSAPPGWPNMPGRSAEHDQNPPGMREGEAPADVTEQQRELERKNRK